MNKTDRNREVFDRVRVADSYTEYAGPVDGFLDRGEAAALVSAAGEVRGTPVLDVGVGSGRTTALLQLISDDYVAIDYAPNMVDAFRRNFPDQPAHVADARHLADFSDGGFGLILFSNNGIDTVQHDERHQVLAEFSRVLDPGGLLVFSTLNRGGQSYLESPFQLHRPQNRISFSPKKIAVTVGRRLLDPVAIVRGIANWFANRSQAQDFDSWALAPLAAHDFALLMHFTTLGDLRELVGGAGFDLVAIYTTDGSVVDSTSTKSSADNFTIVARRR